MNIIISYYIYIYIYIRTNEFKIFYCDQTIINNDNKTYVYIHIVPMLYNIYDIKYRYSNRTFKNVYLFGEVLYCDISIKLL